MPSRSISPSSPTTYIELGDLVAPQRAKRAFSILSGSLANGTTSVHTPPVIRAIFQYPQRIVSQWNPHPPRRNAIHATHFQYPQRIVSQWNSDIIASTAA